MAHFSFRKMVKTASLGQGGGRVALPHTCGFKIVLGYKM